MNQTKLFFKLLEKRKQDLVSFIRYTDMQAHYYDVINKDITNTILHNFCVVFC